MTLTKSHICPSPQQLRADAVQVQDESTLCWATWRSADTELEKLLELAQGFNEQTAKGALDSSSGWVLSD